MVYGSNFMVYLVHKVLVLPAAGCKQRSSELAKRETAPNCSPVAACLAASVSWKNKRELSADPKWARISP